MCIDRTDDWKGYTPCLFEHCAEIQSVCAPKCGSFKDVIKQVGGLLQEANDQRFAQGEFKDNSTELEIKLRYSKVFSESCSRLYCFKDCSKPSTINGCGKNAWITNVDLQWTTLTSMFYSLRQFGVNIDWPTECKTLAMQL
jgi:hypothetical protein